MNPESRNNIHSLIYVITCINCKAQYVGQTKLSIMEKFQKHLLDIKHSSNWAKVPASAKAKGPTNVGLHFSKPNHTAGNVSIQIAELIRATPDSDLAQRLRDDREKHWMYQLKTIIPFGINGTDGSNQVRSRPNQSRQDLHRSQPT